MTYDTKDDKRQVPSSGSSASQSQHKREVYMQTDGSYDPDCYYPPYVIPSEVAPIEHPYQPFDNYFDKISQIGMPHPFATLDELLNRINNSMESASCHFPLLELNWENLGCPAMTVDRFRHYQTLGCIDAPMIDGEEELYGIRHFLQTLLICKLLLLRVPDAFFRFMLIRFPDTQYRLMLRGHILMIGRPVDELVIRAMKHLRKDIRNQPESKEMLVRQLRVFIGKKATEADAMDLLDRLVNAGYISIKYDCYVIYHVRVTRT